MKLRPTALAFILLGVAEVAFYLLNPLHVPTFDPRLRLWGIAPYRAPSRSMEPTIHAGDFFLVSAWPYWFSDPKVGEVIVFRYPPDPSVSYVKRIVAAANSSVELRDGTLIVDGQPVPEPYLNGLRPSGTYSRTMAAIRVPANAYFVLGDNRGNSADSRVWGPLPRANIIGRVVGGRVVSDPSTQAKF